MIVIIYKKSHENLKVLEGSKTPNLFKLFNFLQNKGMYLESYLLVNFRMEFNLNKGVIVRFNKF